MILESGQAPAGLHGRGTIVELVRSQMMTTVQHELLPTSPIGLLLPVLDHPQQALLLFLLLKQLWRPHRTPVARRNMLTHGIIRTTTKTSLN